MRTKINWGFVLLAWMMIEMLGIILIKPGPLTSLGIEVMTLMR
jgi:hypothetical protein